MITLALNIKGYRDVAIIEETTARLTTRTRRK